MSKHAAECIHCGKVSTAEHWLPGEACIFGNLYACSLACAEAWGNAQGRSLREGYHPGQPHWRVEVEPKPPC